MAIITMHRFVYSYVPIDLTFCFKLGRIVVAFMCVFFTSNSVYTCISLCGLDETYGEECLFCEGGICVVSGTWSTCSICKSGYYLWE